MACLLLEQAPHPPLPEEWLTSSNSYQLTIFDNPQQLVAKLHTQTWQGLLLCLPWQASKLPILKVLANLPPLMPVFAIGKAICAQHYEQLYQQGVWYIFDMAYQSSNAIRLAIEQAISRLQHLHSMPSELRQCQDRFQVLYQRQRLLEQELNDCKAELKDAYRELEHALEKQLDYKQQAMRWRSDLDSFLYKLSHDIQGPVASLQGLQNLARLDIQDALALDYVEKMAQNVRKLSRIVQALQKVVNARYAEQSIELVDFHQLFFQLREEFKRLCYKLNVEIRTQIDNRQSFYTARELVYTVFQHLIENALIHGLSTGRSLEQTAYIDIYVHTNSKWALIHVSDEGIGIPPEAQNRVFDLFFKYDPASKGTGVGLYVVRSCVEQLNGRIELQSEPGKGTSFRLTLPNQMPANLVVPSNTLLST